VDNAAGLNRAAPKPRKGSQHGIRCRGQKKIKRSPSIAAAASDLVMVGLFVWGILSARAPIRTHYVAILGSDIGLWVAAFIFTMLALLAVFGEGNAGPVARFVSCALLALFFGWLTLAIVKATTQVDPGPWGKFAIANLAFSKAAFVWSHRHSDGDEVINSFVPIMLAVVCYMLGAAGYGAAMTDPGYHGDYWLYFGAVYFLIMAAEKRWPIRITG
jgi:hypothetical protein